MDGGFGEKLNAVLSDPEAMEKITRIASGISQNGTQNDAQPKNTENISNPMSARSGKAAFISSLRPMLREDKRKKLDSLQTALIIAEMFGDHKKR